VREGWPIAAGGLVATAMVGIDLPLLKALGFGEPAGQYAIGVRFFLVLATIPDLFAAVVLPVLSKRALAGAESRRDAVALGVKALAALGMPAAVGATVLAEPLVTTLAGARYLPVAAWAVAGLMWVFAAEMVSRTLVVQCRAQGRQMIPLAVYGVALAAKLVAALVWVPRGGAPVLVGITAGAALLVACGMVWATGRWVVRDLSPWRLLRASVARPLLAALLMGLALWPVREAPLVLTLPAGLAAYAVAALALGVVGRRERALLWAVVTRR
jgi:O-antigen/teichoic acid export membrane protein